MPDRRVGRVDFSSEDFVHLMGMPANTRLVSCRWDPETAQMIVYLEHPEFAVAPEGAPCMRYTPEIREMFMPETGRVGRYWSWFG